MEKKSLFTLIVLLASLSITLASQPIDANIGRNLSESEMASMLGGGFQCPDKDCDTSGPSCPDNSCGDVFNLQACYDCSGEDKKVCGDWQQSWGWLCKNNVKTCAGLSAIGTCTQGLCDTLQGAGTGDPEVCTNVVACD